MSLKIYYLDDEFDLLEMFHDTFSSLEVEVSTFSSVTDFLDAVKANSPDIVFLDYRLPGCTGDDVAKKLDPQLPKVLISGDLELITESNFLSVLGKPFKKEKVKEIINSLELKKISD